MFDIDIDDRPVRRDPRRTVRARGWRGRHRHVFAWAVLGAGTVAIGLLVYGLLSALGVGGLLAQAYFGAALAVLPAAWHGEFQALPGIVHVLLVVGALGLVAAVAGEVLD